MTQLKLYGENAFTFLFFNEIKGDVGKLNTLLRGLKRFDEPRTKFLKKRDCDLKDRPEIWLFPSFGKRHGFGEPDALLLIDKYAFWFEVETTFNLGGIDQSDANDSLRQLYRFHCAALAFAKGPRREKGGFFIKGSTITNGGLPKCGRLALRGHKAVAELRKRLRTVCISGNSHYVLLSVHQPSGGAKGFHRELENSAETAFRSWDDILGWSGGTGLLQLNHCWYTYWSGDLNGFFNKNDLLAGYVAIKKGS